jgi:hypothetical protein
MAWMSMMGADSVAYHDANAAERADDHRGQALEYDASRGETQCPGVAPAPPSSAWSGR